MVDLVTSLAADRVSVAIAVSETDVQYFPPKLSLAAKNRDHDSWQTAPYSRCALESGATLFNTTKKDCIAL